MKVPFVGPSYQMDALSFGIQRSINLFPIISEIGSTKSKVALRSCPGYTEFASIGGGPIRNGIASTANRSFWVSGTGFYEVFQDGTSVLRGSINTQVNRVSLAENALQVIVVDGQDGWIFTKSDNSWQQISSANFPTTSVVTYQDGYFIVVEDGTQNFFISGINDGLSWAALDFTTVESSPDNLVSVISDNSNLWLFGNRSVEVFQNTGDALFPFQRIPGAVIQTGCAGKFTVQKFDNTVAWLGVDEQGQGVVWVANGYSAERISTQAIEKRINSALDYSDSYAWVYHQQGHIFYCLQIRGLDTTLVYDGATRQWHERMYKDPVTNTEQLHRGSCHVFFAQKNLIGDRVDNKIYELSLSYFDDNGDELVRERISPHYQDEKKPISYAAFELDMEVGVGLNTGQGDDPQIMLQYSDDGGRNWSSELWQTMGKIGAFNNRVIWRQLGRSRDRVFKVMVSDPVFVQFNEATVNAT